MPSLNTICYEAISRIYRNAVVAHIRTTLQSVYPDDWEARVRLPFQKEWDQIRENADLRRRTGEISENPLEDIELLGVNHFYNLFDTYFDECFPCRDNISSQEHRQIKHAVLGWSREIKNLRDALLGHPATDDVPQQDALRMLDSARRILDFIDPTASEAVADLWHSIVGDDVVVNEVDIGPSRPSLEASTLPAREFIAPSFVGRQHELDKLREWILDPDSHTWLLVGDGGKGKTAIAYEFATEVRNLAPQALDIVIWLSAKVRRFQNGASADIEAPDFWDLDSALDWVLRAYGAVDFEHLGLREKQTECLSYLEQLPALIILDDVDSLEGGGLQALNFFSFQTARTPSKVLLTSRRITHFGMEPITTEIAGFDPQSDDGIAFVKTRIRMNGLDDTRFSRGVIVNILEACDGSPLYTQDLLRLCIVGETPQNAIRLWKERDGETARRYALGRELEMLSASARATLLTCALYRSSISLPEITAVADLSEDECRKAIAELQNLFLVRRPSFIEEVPRFGLNVNTRQLVLEVDGSSDRARRIEAAIERSLSESSGVTTYRQKVQQHILQARSSVRLNRFVEAEGTLQSGLASYRRNAQLAGNLGWVYKSWRPQPRYTDARDWFQKAAEWKSSDKDMYWHWSAMEQACLEWTSGAEAAERGLETLGPCEDLSNMAGQSRSYLAKDLLQQAQYGRAEQEARKAETHLKAALTDLEHVGIGQYQSHSRVWRAIVINYERLALISQAQRERRAEEHFLRLLAHSLTRWDNEHPGGPNTASERERLVYKFPNLSDYLS